MSKYMAAGRHGGYRDNEFRERESDYDVSKRELPYSKGEYDQLKNGNNLGNDRGKNQNQVLARVRHRDVKDREMVNGGGYRSASRSFSGGLIKNGSP